MIKVKDLLIIIKEIINKVDGYKFNLYTGKDTYSIYDIENHIYFDFEEKKYVSLKEVYYFINEVIEKFPYINFVIKKMIKLYPKNREKYQILPKDLEEIINILTSENFESEKINKKEAIKTQSKILKPKI